MSVLVDTSFLFALKNLKDSNHERAVALYRSLMDGEYGRPHVTNLVFAEAVTVALHRTGRHSAALGMGDLILQKREGRPVFLMHHLSPDELIASWEELRSHRDCMLSLTDWTSVIVTQNLELDGILSFDSDFDGLLPRIS